MLKVQDLGTQPQLVLLHGWGVNCGVFDSIAEVLNRDYSVRLIDLPGFGKNNQQEINHLSFSEFCALVAGALPENAIVLGWSLGGLVAQQLASVYSDKVRALVTVCSSPWFIDSQDWPGIKSKVLTGFQEQLEDDFQQTLERFLAIQAMGSESARRDLKMIKQSVLHQGLAGKGALQTGLEYLASEDLRECLKTQKCPALRIFGNQDSLVPKRVIEQIKKLDPDAQYEVFTKASHAPFISHPAEFLAVLRGFLQAELG